MQSTWGMLLWVMVLCIAGANDQYMGSVPRVMRLQSPTIRNIMLRNASFHALPDLESEVMNIRLRTILVGMPAEIHDGRGPDPWFSGFMKRPVTGPVHIGRDNIVGDGQADRTVHGGSEKAILGYCSDHYGSWRADLQRDDLDDGSFGENIAFTGLDEERAAIGSRYRVGSAVIEVSQPRQPCWKLARRCGLPSMPAKAIANGRLGWYFRVIEEGDAQAGCPVTPCGDPHPTWTIARINRLFFGPLEAARSGLVEALGLPEMSPEFIAICAKRLG